MKVTLPAIVALSSAVFASSLAIADCIDYRDYIHRVAELYLDGSALAVATQGPLVCVATQHGLAVVDATTPSFPQVLGIVETPDYAYGVAVSGKTALVVTATGLIYGHGCLYAIDISDPYQPEIVNSVNTGPARGVAINGDRAFVVCGNDYEGHPGLRIFDISNLPDLQQVAWVSLPEIAFGVEASEDYAYIADGEAGLQVVDLTAPSGPQIVGSVGHGNHYSGVSVSGNYAYLANQDGRLEVVDTTDPTAPVVVGSVECPGAYRVTVTGARAYVGAGSGYGMTVVDVSNPDDPVIIGEYTTGTVSGLAVAGELAYVTASTLQVVEIDNPENPPLEGEVDTPGLARGVAVSGNVACIADGESGIEVIDVTIPESPQTVGCASTPGQAIAVAVSGGYLYAAWSGTANSGLSIFDLADPHAPIAMGSIAVDGSAMDVVVSGSHAYLVDNPSSVGRLSVIDLRDPWQPVIVGSVQTTGVATGVAVEGDLVCVSAWAASNYNGLLDVISVDNPAAPRIVGTVISSSWWSEGVVIDGDYAYAWLGRFFTIDISNPALPRVVSNLEMHGYSVAISGSFVYLAGFRSLQIIDVSNPSAPLAMGQSVFTCRDAVVAGPRVYVAAENAGLRVVPAQCDPLTVVRENDDGGETAHAAVLGCHPNPFNPRTTVSFTLPSAGQVQVAIYDAKGQMVARLVDEALAAGVHTVDWDGRDAYGASMPSGTYFCRLTTSWGVETRKLSLLR